jgi:hypothetical protein
MFIGVNCPINSVPMDVESAKTTWTVSRLIGHWDGLAPGHCSFTNSALAFCKMGMLGSASFQSVGNS